MRSPIRVYLEGLLLVPRTMVFSLQHRHLFSAAAAPLIVTLLVDTAFCWWLWAWLHALGLSVFLWILSILLGLVSVSLFSILIYNLVSLPFRSWLSDHMASFILHRKPTPMNWHQELLKALTISGTLILGFLISLIPFLQIPGMALQARGLALDALSYPVQLLGPEKKHLMTFWKTHRWACWGLGSGLLILLCIPLLGFLTPFYSVLAGYLFFERFQNELE